jgi:uncharacterized protein YjbJ (UPF0337 family)
LDAQQQQFGHVQSKLHLCFFNPLTYIKTAAIWTTRTAHTASKLQLALFLLQVNGHDAVPNDNQHRTDPRRWKNKDTVKGTVDDIAGRAKRHVGEWTGDTNAQAEAQPSKSRAKLRKPWATSRTQQRT